jgi:prophage antirepressor-like protein
VTKAKAPRELDLFGNPIEERPRDPVLRLPYEDSKVRVVMKNGEPWWVAKDVCRILDIQNPRDTLAKQVAEDEKGVEAVYTPGGEQQMLVVNEPGLYRLIFTSRKPEAEQFRRWVFHHILPTLRKTGTYQMPRAEKVRRRLKCDPATACERVKQLDANKADRARMLADGADVGDLADWHNAGYRGQFGRTAAELRGALGQRAWETPLDRMGEVPLAANRLAKAVARRASLEQSVPVEKQPALLESISREITSETLAKLGPGRRFGLVDDERRGRIIDVVPIPAALPPPATPQQ